MDRLSHFFSFVFSPLLVPSYGIALALNFSMLCFLPPSLKWKVVGVVFLITAVIPALMIAALKTFGLVSDLGLNKRNERALPYCIVCLSYLVTAYYFYAVMFPWWLVMFMAGATAAVIVSMIVNMWWKISAHMAAMGGAVALLLRIAADGYGIPATFPMLLTVILLTGVVGTARVHLERHTLGQVIAGAINGAFCVWLATALV